MTKGRRVWKFTVTRGHLAELDGFRVLEAEHLDAVAAQMMGFGYAAGQEIVTHKDVSQDVYFILSGEIRVNIYSLEGRQITFEMLGSGSMFGELAAIDGEERSASCVAESRVELAKLSANRFREMIRHHPDLADASMRRLAALARHLCAKLAQCRALRVAARVRLQLHEIAEGAAGELNSVVVDPAPTDSDIAGRAGTTREAVNREIAVLSTMGLVHRRAGALVFADIRGLGGLTDPFP